MHDAFSTSKKKMTSESKKTKTGVLPYTSAFSMQGPECLPPASSAGEL
jgi:hypothetical protein